MDTYSLLREFADSWFLLFMFTFFIGTGIWAFWPSMKADRDAAAQIPFNEDKNGCDKSCADCACNSDMMKGLIDG